ncbi:hypothetical protein KKF91_03800 [Myxococcota bacterium]|nr:hypothetical protein [Myxococcota bacterium]MBU1429667.1 hypothetical protein [Myxococcota bacterium]MBU1898128.1 hypothetical protein [Myxococcota bacterium]
MQISNGLYTASQGGAASSQSNVSVEKEGFLKLLVAQISNQDPMAPNSSEQYVQQLTQFSTLEQLMNLNAGVETLSLGQLSNNSQEAIGFVGKSIVTRGDHLDLEANASAEMSFGLSGQADEVTIKVMDEQGRVVHEGKLYDPEGARVRYTWDGRDADGERLPPGRYQVSVEARGAAGPVGVDLLTEGFVDGVRYDNGYPELMIGARRVRMNEVIEVRAG